MLHILTPEYCPQVGGVADYTRLIARALHDAGDEVHVWSPGAGTGDGTDPFAIHPELGGFAREDLERTSQTLDRFPSPRRLLVQWVPHGYGFNAMNVPFCMWLWQRAAGGDDVELMVHEPYLAFWEGSWRQNAAAAVHRMMTMILLRAASRVWLSIPAWEPMWSPYRMGRAVPFAWLPIPSSLPEPAASDVGRVRSELANGRLVLVGHLGTYGSLVTSLLEGALAHMAMAVPDAQFLLLGEGSSGFREHLVASRPFPADRVAAAGFLNEQRLAAHVAACDLLVQPYPDGITSRRTSAMASLKLGVPLVTTRGRLTERLWTDTSGVLTAQVGDAASLVDHVQALAASPERRRQLGATGKELYRRFFDVRYTVDALRRPLSREAA